MIFAPEQIHGEATNSQVNGLPPWAGVNSTIISPVDNLIRLRVI